jgi:hypothetical protein
VDAEVANKVFPIGKGFPAFFALKRFFSSVGSFVQNEGRAVSEGLPTVTAHKRLLPSVDALVPLEV